MNNSEVAAVFQDIADLLEIKGENTFKIRAYQRAARSIEHLPQELGLLVNEGRLREVPGIGDAISKKITELITTGRLEYYDSLRAEFPEGITAFLEIPGIGPKTAMRLTQELGIKSADELEAAIVDGKVAGLFRMGDKTAESILHHIRSMRTKEQRIPIGVVLPIVDDITALLCQCPGLRNLVPAGSLRRFKETIGDIDLMGTAEEAPGIIDAFVELPQIREILVKGGTKASVIIHQNLQVDLRVVEHDAFGSLLQYFTGSKEHNIILRERAHRQGLKLSEYGIADLGTGQLEKFSSEEGFYSRLGLEFIPPELREGQLEIERAERGALPRLVEISDMKGDFHIHTDWSDGHDSIEAMALAARALGYQYLAITDHSAGRGIAHGLNEERLRKQMAVIDELNKRLDGIRVLSGVEVDIRADGSLDLSDGILSDLDVVIAAVHSAMGHEEGKMTRRIIRALENPNVDILAHPSCRLLNQRDPIAADWEAIFRSASETDTMLEISAMPDRLDLRDLHAYRARELGVRLVVNTDAHAIHHLTFMRFGIGVARRGWCEAEHIANTRPLKDVWSYLGGHK